MRPTLKGTNISQVIYNISIVTGTVTGTGTGTGFI